MAYANSQTQNHSIDRTRTSSTWVGTILFMVVLALLLIFILQNQSATPLSFLGFQGSIPVGVAMLLSAVIGGILVAIAGASRVMQLRRLASRHKTEDAGRDDNY